MLMESKTESMKQNHTMHISNSHAYVITMLQSLQLMRSGHKYTKGWTPKLMVSLKIYNNILMIAHHSNNRLLMAVIISNYWSLL